MTRLEELVEINPRVKRADKPYSFIAVADVDAELAVVQPSGLAQRNAPYRVARPGDVLLARISPSMENGKVAIVPSLDTEEALVSTELMVLRPKPAVDPRLVWSFFRQQRVRNALRLMMVGSSGRQRLRTEVLERVEIRVPDDPSWDISVRVLEHLDEARRLQRLFGERIRALPAAAAASIASGSPLTSLGSLGVELRPGAAEFTSESGGTQVLRSTNVIEGRIDRRDPLFLSGPEEDADILRDGDLLIVRAAGNTDAIGRGAVYEDDGQPTTYGAPLLLLRGNRLDSDFLWAWLESAMARAAIRQTSWERPDRYRLALDAVRNLPVPRLPAEAEIRIGELARAAKRLAGISAVQAGLLDRAVQAHLGVTFGDALAAARVEAPPQRAPAEVPLPQVFEAASDRQRQLWQKVGQLGEGFGLTDVAQSEAEHAWVQHCLALFEQLGLIVRESVDESHHWRQPDLELEVLN
jgi:type I restriction enzyme S subunit